VANTRAAQNLFTAVLDATVLVAAPVATARLNYVTIHFSAAVSETVSIFLHPGVANYQTAFFQHSILAAQEFYFYPSADILVVQGEGVRVHCTNLGVGAALTAYLTVSLEEYL